MSNTIVYLTDNRLDEKVMKLCQRKLLEAADGRPIISVSQFPIDFGKNICVGNIKRSWYSLYRQLLLGLEAAETDSIAIAEHDCIYVKEHIDFIPPKDDRMYYNGNCWIAQWDCRTHPEFNGMYSYWPKRTPMSQLIANREMLLEDTKLRLRVLTDPSDDVSVERAQMYARVGRPFALHYLIKHKLPDHPFDRFYTQIPNLDIRHGRNFTGAKRGKKRCFEIPYWGKFKDVMEA